MKIRIASSLLVVTTAVVLLGALTASTTACSSNKCDDAKAIVDRCNGMSMMSGGDSGITVTTKITWDNDKCGDDDTYQKAADCIVEKNDCAAIVGCLLTAAH